MKKIVMLLAIVGLTGAGFAFAPAEADTYYTCGSSWYEEVEGVTGENPDPGIGDGCLEVNDSGSAAGYLDGADDNPDPSDGYIVVEAGQDEYEGEGTLCASAEGDPQHDVNEEGDPENDPEDDPDCDDALPQGVVDYLGEQS